MCRDAQTKRYWALEPLRVDCSAGGRTDIKRNGNGNYRQIFKRCVCSSFHGLRIACGNCKDVQTDKPRYVLDTLSAFYFTITFRKYISPENGLLDCSQRSSHFADGVASHVVEAGVEVLHGTVVNPAACEITARLWCEHHTNRRRGGQAKATTQGHVARRIRERVSRGAPPICNT